MGELPASSAFRRAAMVESIGSSPRIEGNAITDPAVEQMLSRLFTNPEGSFSPKDEQEAGMPINGENTFMARHPIHCTYPRTASGFVYV